MELLDISQGRDVELGFSATIMLQEDVETDSQTLDKRIMLLQLLVPNATSWSMLLTQPSAVVLHHHSCWWMEQLFKAPSRHSAMTESVSVAVPLAVLELDESSPPTFVQLIVVLQVHHLS